MGLFENIVSNAKQAANVVGKKTGEEVEVNVTFPEEYHEASLKGKPALFKVKIKEIMKRLAELFMNHANKALILQKKLMTSSF